MPSHGAAAHVGMSIVLRILEPDMKGPLSSAGLDHYLDFVGCSIGELVHESGTTRTRRISVGTSRGDEVLFLKTYRYQDKAIPLRMTRSKSVREANNYRLMRERCGIDVPDVVAFGSRRFGLMMCDGFLLTRAVPSAEQLDLFAAARWPLRDSSTGDALRRYLLRHTADLISRMHASHVYHVDLQWRNLLVSTGDSAQPRVFVLDCSRGGRRVHPWRREHGRLRDLSSLYKEARTRITPRQQIWWLRRYLGVHKLSDLHRTMIRSIVLDRSIKDHEESA